MVNIVRVGLLEDDKNQTELIDLWVSEIGGQLKSYTTGHSFREAVERETFDVLVLDWQLPDTTGLDELDWIRGEKSLRIPVLFITSRDSEDSVIEALDHGADDYMVKPVSKAVTLARIRALYRRGASSDSDSWKATEDDASPQDIESYTPYTINTREQSIALNGEPAKLTHKEYELAEHLFRHAGCLVARDYLLQAIWGTRGDLNTRTVDTHISRVRSKLHINPGNGWQLASIYQRGYRLFRVGQD